MNNRSWSQARSDFNHAWVKNRLIVTLSRARQVIDGSVEDDSVWEDLHILLSDWPNRKAEALEVLNSFGTAMMSTLPGDIAANINAATTAWLAQLVRSRWSQTAHPEQRLAEAKSAVETMDRKVEALHAALQTSIAPVQFAAVITEAQRAASSLGAAFSALDPGYL